MAVISRETVGFKQHLVKLQQIARRGYLSKSIDMFINEYTTGDI